MTPKEKTLINGLGRGLKCEVIEDGEIKVGTLLAVYSDGSCVFEDIIESYQGFIVPPKPYLRDLSDLDKEIEQDGERFIPIGRLHYLYCLTPTGKRSKGQYEVFEDVGFIGTIPMNAEYKKGIRIWHDMRRTQYRVVEKLLNWHFNVFNLPETEYIRVNNQNNPY